MEPYEKLLSLHCTALSGKRASRTTSQLGQSSRAGTAGEQGRVAAKTEGEEGEGQTGEEEEREDEEEEEGVFIVLCLHAVMLPGSLRRGCSIQLYSPVPIPLWE